MSVREEDKRMVAELSPEDRQRHLAAWIAALKLVVARNADNQNAATKLLAEVQHE